MREGGDGTIGTRTMQQDQRDHVNNGVHFPDYDAVGGNAVEADRAPEDPIEDDMQAGRTENAMLDDRVNEDQTSFELSSWESNDLSGRWWMFYSEGYPH